MRLDDLPVTDVRSPLVAQRAELLALLAKLAPDQWARPSAAPGWSVKDVALHLLDVDLSWLAHRRDGDTCGLIDGSGSRAEFVRRLAERNQRWVDGARVLSPRLVIELLDWSGRQLTEYLESVDLCGPSSVYWAGPAPLWFDLAREFTERWVHGRQILEACTSDRDASADQYLDLAIRTFVWGFPYQYRAEAAAGTTVGIHITGIGSWRLTRGAEAWSLDDGAALAASATLTMTGDTAWRFLTGARYAPDSVAMAGPGSLLAPLLRVRGVIA